MKKHEEKLIKAALRWWKAHRPSDWDEKEHLLTPGVNTFRVSEYSLGYAVAAYIKATKPKAKRK